MNIGVHFVEVKHLCAILFRLMGWSAGRSISKMHAACAAAIQSAEKKRHELSNNGKDGQESTEVKGKFEIRERKIKLKSE